MTITPPAASEGAASSVPITPTIGSIGSDTQRPAPEVAPGVFELRVEDHLSEPVQRLREALEAPVVLHVSPAVQAQVKEAAPLLLSAEEWAKQKNTPDWALAAARARRLSNPDHPQRAAWLPNGQLSEADFDATLTETLEGSLR